MSRITELFKKKPKNVLNVYCTAGYPHAESTLEIIRALKQNGADLIELGIPYSDPLADGPVIQASGSVALQNGMTLKKLFEQLEPLRDPASAFYAGDLPLVLMGYMNPVLQFGFEKFCAACAKTGIDGLILPDLPQYEFESEYGAIIKKYGLDFIFLVTPETSAKRVRTLDALSSGFLYAVSSSSTTGRDKDLQAQSGYFSKLQEMQLTNPVLIGFGIKDKQTFDTACGFSNGAIIGSAYIKALDNNSDPAIATKKFMDSILT